VDWKLELVPLPVADVERAKAFYMDKVGFNLDHDVRNGDLRVVQLTPPGSACSIVIGKGIVNTPPGSVKLLHLVVPDIQAARAELVERGVEVTEVQDLGGGITMACFDDPDGNSWAVQHIAPGAGRLPPEG
jgi:predicted enzyme related to lactoylglutathione lyase